MRLFTFLSLLVVVTCDLLPNRNNYLRSLSTEELIALPRSVLEDSLLDIVGLITKYGYPVETHEVKTEDGYILAIHRIPHGKSGYASQYPPVFLQHGILGTAADWIINGPKISLGYLLADAGFDVWMGNARGNTYSKRHCCLNPDSSQFWRFSWHEIGFKDLPAMIDYVLGVTGEQKLHYVGYSQGTTTFFVMASEKPEYNDKILSMHALSPVAYMGNLKSPLIRELIPLVDTVEIITTLIGVNEFLPSNDLMSFAANLLCRKGSIFVPVCSNILFLIAGFNPNQLNMTLLPVYFSHTGGSSSKQIIHYGQEVISKKFRQYDYGYKNAFIYGTSTPPIYKTNLITAPTFLYYSDNDWLADIKDVIRLSRELRNVVGNYSITRIQWNHLDFIWGINAKDLIYNRVIAHLKDFKV